MGGMKDDRRRQLDPGFPKRFRQARVAAYRSQRAFARDLPDDIRVEGAMVSQWENGDSEPSRFRWRGIAKTLGCDYDYLFDYENYQKKQKVAGNDNLGDSSASTADDGSGGAMKDVWRHFGDLERQIADLRSRVDALEGDTSDTDRPTGARRKS